MDYYQQSPEEVLKKLHTSKKGLNKNEVQKRFAKHGKNVIEKVKTKSKLKILFSQFNSFIIYILIFAGIVSLLIGHAIDAAVIFAIVLLNGVIGFAQEYKAEEIIEKLKKSLSYKAMVVRDGVRKEIDSKFLIPGDICFLEVGDRVLADCRIIEQENFEVNEAVLSGESFPVEKKIELLSSSVVLTKRNNMVYAGTTISKGRATAVVVQTGSNTEFGNLANLVQKTKSDKTPLEKKINLFSKNISIAILGFVFVAFLIGVYLGIELVEMFMVSISLAIGAIPEGLPAIIAITLAASITQMKKVNTLVRKLPSAETLGRTTVICTDKTGTLTEEELTVDSIYSRKQRNIDSIKNLDFNTKKLFEIGILCNNARDEGSVILGDPTETALIKAAKKFNLEKKSLTEKNPRHTEFSFDSQRKMMSIIRTDGVMYSSYVKGAPQFILEKCTKELINGKISLLSKKRKSELENALQDMEKHGLRVLGFAFRSLGKNITRANKLQTDAETHLTFTGFIGMIDPPRKEVKNAIKEAQEAGITIKVITGDSAMTTLAVAKKLGLKGTTIEGKTLGQLDKKQFDEAVKAHTIFARVTPEQKLKIVDTLKEQGEVVGVTGDGVNDILALKRADIGIAMGIRGTDVARESSDIVLLDDNFASIVGAIKQGRRVFDNMKKSIKFLLAANLGEVFAVILALILGFPLIFLPLAILWMNLVTDSLPALALALEPAERNILKRKPENKNLLYGIWNYALVAGILMVISALAIFNYGFSNFGVETARTMAITTAIFFELFFVFSCKSNDSIFKTGILNNKYLIGAVALSILLHLIAIYTGLGSLFEFIPLTLSQLGWSILAGVSGLIVFESWKLGKMFKNNLPK
ncbi:HAD-IC family P-type ATPase [archaeon]|jgi:P-type Ca2+ transporter type 2C|nr:HAD-IC family P-type ATPase [archaeon]MBT6606729.1 HAD-IC family P-type ATPase [archaeon]MBT7251287.1 HAD-IC family P-type ATPase [archaeon]MBT7661211.1 HAD-IC family P-type ATPase [archaeon]